MHRYFPSSHKTISLVFSQITKYICSSIEKTVKKSAIAFKQGLSQAAPLRQSRTAIGIVPLKNGQGDNLSPSKFREKTRKEAHTKKFILVQKLQAETERGKYILSHL